MKHYKFDREQLKLKEDKTTLLGYLKKGAVILISAVVLSILYYAVFALFYSTEKEKNYQLENKVYQNEYDQMKKEVDLIDQVIDNLAMKDQYIYEDIFNADPPFLSSRYDKNELTLIDTTSIIGIGRYSARTLDRLLVNSERCDYYIEEINSLLSDSLAAIAHIPSIFPVKDFTVMQTGASVGKKIHPFYKTLTDHNGMDLITPISTPVLSTADGKVVNVERSKRNKGNRIEIDHGNGYVTTYSHLSDILVSKGKTVKQGTVIGRVGLSGKTFAPHLHYEVIFEGKYQDPINYFLSELTPASYREMLMIAINTGQSLD